MYWIWYISLLLNVTLVVLMTRRGHSSHHPALYAFFVFASVRSVALMCFPSVRDPGYGVTYWQLQIVQWAILVTVVTEISQRCVVRWSAIPKELLVIAARMFAISILVVALISTLPSFSPLPFVANIRALERSLTVLLFASTLIIAGIMRELYLPSERVACSGLYGFCLVSGVSAMAHLATPYSSGTGFRLAGLISTSSYVAAQVIWISGCWHKPKKALVPTAEEIRTALEMLRNTRFRLAESYSAASCDCRKEKTRVA